MTKKSLLISFSGGRTSAYMMWWILNNWKDEYEILVVFANTGKEHEKTLEFVRDCEVHFDVPIVWVESVHIQNPKSGKWWGVSGGVLHIKW